MSNKKLLYVLIAIVLAVIAGLLTGTESSLFGVTYYQIYSLIGKLFLNALMLVVVPLVVSSIISGTARMGKDQSFAILGAKTFAVFLGTNLLAILIGWALAMLIQPGALQSQAIPLSSNGLSLASAANDGGFEKVEQIFLRLIPSNIFAAASEAQMLGLIIFSLLFGFFITKIPHEYGDTLTNFWLGIFLVMMKMTEFFMKFMPIGVFGLVAKVVATTGIETITNVSYYFLTVLAGLLIFMLIALSILLLTIAKVHPLSHLKAMMPALLTAFSTSSSAATLPVALECVEKKSGVSNRIASFTLPLGTSVNLAGSSLQVIVSVIFIAGVYGVDLHLSTQIIIVLMAWLLSLGVAGVPSASLISIVIILTAIGFPADGIGLIMAVERILDMCRTTVNTYTNSCSAVIIARSEGEKLPIGV